MSETPLSAHDHGNCELCDQIERELSAAQAKLAQANASRRIPELDNHHNALLCGYCSGPLKSSLEEVEAKLAALTAPGEYDDLKARLREAADEWRSVIPDTAALGYEAATAIEQLQARVRELEQETKRFHCPIGMADGSDICSASTCYDCLIMHFKAWKQRAEQAEARAEKFKKIADDVLRANPLIVDQRATAEAVRRAEQAEAKLAECKEDAERLTFFEQTVLANEWEIESGTLGGTPFYRLWFNDCEYEGKDLRAAIDAAQQKAKEEEK